MITAKTARPSRDQPVGVDPAPPRDLDWPREERWNRAAE